MYAHNKNIAAVGGSFLNAVLICVLTSSDKRVACFTCFALDFNILFTLKMWLCTIAQYKYYSTVFATLQNYFVQQWWRNFCKCANRLSAQHTKIILLFLQKRADTSSVQQAKQSVLCFTKCVRNPAAPQQTAALCSSNKIVHGVCTRTFFCV